MPPLPLTRVDTKLEPEDRSSGDHSIGAPSSGVCWLRGVSWAAADPAPAAGGRPGPAIAARRITPVDSRLFGGISGKSGSLLKDRDSVRRLASRATCARVPLPAIVVRSSTGERAASFETYIPHKCTRERSGGLNQLENMSHNSL